VAQDSLVIKMLVSLNFFLLFAGDTHYKRDYLFCTASKLEVSHVSNKDARLAA
jgi:hypothetical protein